MSFPRAMFFSSPQLFYRLFDSNPACSYAHQAFTLASHHNQTSTSCEYRELRTGFATPGAAAGFEMENRLETMANVEQSFAAWWLLPELADRLFREHGER